MDKKVVKKILEACDDADMIEFAEYIQANWPQQADEAWAAQDGGECYKAFEEYISTNWPQQADEAWADIVNK